MDQQIPQASSWSLGQKVAFRFFALFFLIYIFPFPISYIPWFEFVSDFYSDEILHNIIPWIGANILQLENPITTFTNGSGDTTYDYVLELFFLVFAFVGAMVWSVLDRKRPSYRNAYYWVRVATRYYLGVVMLSYGLSKVFKVQFPAPDVYRLTETYGDFSPMGLAWSFMGFSTAYCIFTGLGEVIGGSLLFFRKTRLLGSLILIAVMSNVVMINLCYDVPVKLFSSTLLLMCFFLAAQDYQRLVNLFVLNKPVEQGNLYQPSMGRKWKYGLYVLKAIVIVFFFYKKIDQKLESRAKYGDDAPKPALYGLYDVEEFVYNGDTLPPLTTDTTRWKAMMVNWDGYVSFRSMEDKWKTYKCQLDTVDYTMEINKRRGDDTTHYFVDYSLVDSVMTVDGVLFGDSLHIEMKQRDLSKFRLTSRGFNWVNEYPYNR